MRIKWNEVNIMPNKAKLIIIDSHDDTASNSDITIYYHKLTQTFYKLVTDYEHDNETWYQGNCY